MLKDFHRSIETADKEFEEAVRSCCEAYQEATQLISSCVEEVGTCGTKAVDVAAAAAQAVHRTASSIDPRE